MERFQCNFSVLSNIMLFSFSIQSPMSCRMRSNSSVLRLSYNPKLIMKKTGRKKYRSNVIFLIEKRTQLKFGWALLLLLLFLLLFPLVIVVLRYDVVSPFISLGIVLLF